MTEGMGEGEGQPGWGLGQNRGGEGSWLWEAGVGGLAYSSDKRTQVGMCDLWCLLLMEEVDPERQRC